MPRVLKLLQDAQSCGPSHSAPIFSHLLLRGYPPQYLPSSISIKYKGRIQLDSPYFYCHFLTGSPLRSFFYTLISWSIRLDIPNNSSLVKTPFSTSHPVSLLNFNSLGTMNIDFLSFIIRPKVAFAHLIPVSICVIPLRSFLLSINIPISSPFFSS